MSQRYMCKSVSAWRAKELGAAVALVQKQELSITAALRRFAIPKTTSTSLSMAPRIKLVVAAGPLLFHHGRRENSLSPCKSYRERASHSHVS